MNNLPDIKIGIVACSRDWLPVEYAEKKRTELIESYISKYGENGIYECTVCLNDNEVNIKRVLKNLQNAECDALCLFYANYGPESTGASLAAAFDGPVMIVGAEDDSAEMMKSRRDAMCGVINSCYAFGIKDIDVYIPANPIGSIEECANMINSFLRISRTLIALNNLKVVSFGTRPANFYGSFAALSALFDLGIDISEFSELELYNAFEKHEGDRRIDGIVAEIKEELGDSCSIETGLLEKFAQYEATLLDYVRTSKGYRKYVAFANACWPAFPSNFGFTPCYINSRLTGKGIPVACEVDVYGAISEYIGQAISDSTVAILDLNNNVPAKVYNDKISGKIFNGKTYNETDLFIGYHCGNVNSKLMSGAKLSKHYINDQLGLSSTSEGTIQGRIIESGVTIFRIQATRDNRVQAYVAQGQVLPVELETYGSYGVFAVPELMRFYRHVILEQHFPNHTIVLFGHYANEIIGVLRKLNITSIYCNNPKNVLYENETIYDSAEEYY